MRVSPRARVHAPAKCVSGSSSCAAGVAAIDAKQVSGAPGAHHVRHAESCHA